MICQVDFNGRIKALQFVLTWKATSLYIPRRFGPQMLLTNNTIRSEP